MPLVLLLLTLPLFPLAMATHRHPGVAVGRVGGREADLVHCLFRAFVAVLCFYGALNMAVLLQILDALLTKKATEADLVSWGVRHPSAAAPW